MTLLGLILTLALTFVLSIVIGVSLAGVIRGALPTLPTLRKRCQFCKLSEGDVLEVERVNSYETETYRYHESCLCDALNLSEDHLVVDLALDIVDCLEIMEYERKRRARRRENARTSARFKGKKLCGDEDLQRAQ